MTIECKTVNIPAPCIETTWTCNVDGTEHSNCGTTRTSTACSLSNNAAKMIAGTIAKDLRYDVNDNGNVDAEDVTLIRNGTALRAYHPANITATNFPTPTVPSGLTNTVDVIITWTNTGEVSGSFTPKIMVGSSAIDLGLGTINIASKATYTTPSKRLNNIPSGNQNFCPNPN